MAMDFKSPLRETNGRWVAQRVQSEGEAWSEDEDASSTASRDGNVCNDALHVVGLHGPGDKISLFLQECELAKVALSCHMALDMLCQEMHEAWWKCGCQMSLVSKKGEGSE